ncbi:ranBP2-like and GRIP domain-containing protein 4 [Caerostris extrusa]|uniref:RanBP2-like and GRIP domain-containing protein 4 n=1 Tax=Caerostris extrusa TaxID=172846 RepID=A0AAV4NVA3_CAEEX|nr:ranBP2-like and GRIP domain-containing protein 4 [Caerostris extrusa]
MSKFNYYIHFLGSSADEPTIPATVEQSLELPATSPNTNVPFSTSKFASFSFAELASKASSDSLTKSSPSSKNIFADAGAPVFSNLNTTGEETDEVVQSGDIHFEPAIPLPDLVEVKTGEEDETPIFVHRAKLFRYDSNTKQWKERGVGDIKILSHKEKVRFRIILRRDQVHNVACNHCISEDMSLSPMATSDTALCWNALDFSDSPNGEASQFAVRFKLKETLDNFKQVFNNCKEQLVNQPRNTSENQITDELSSTLKLKEESETSSESTPDVVNYGTESKTEESETDSDSSSEEDVLFEKRATLEIFDEKAAKFMSVGIGKLKIVYDDTVFGYHITMKKDNGETMCDHIIAVQTCLRTEGKRAMWAALDLNVEPVVRKQFCVTFSSYEALKEFSLCFEEGKEIAIKSEIVEKTD